MNRPSPKQWFTTNNYKPNNVYVKGESLNAQIRYESDSNKEGSKDSKDAYESYEE